MGIRHFVNAEGKGCELDDGRDGDLGGLLRNYHDCDCQCATCAERESTMTTMTAAELVTERMKAYRAAHPQATDAEAYREVLRDPVLKAAYAKVDAPVAPLGPVSGTDVVRAGDLIQDARDGYRREYAGAQLGQKAAGDFLLRFKKDHLARTGCSEEEAWAVTFQLNPGETRAYLRLPGPSVADALRKIGAGTVVVEHGTASFVIHDYKVKPGLAGPKTAEEARDELRRLVRERMKQGPADAMLDVITTEAGRALLDLVLQGDEEPEGEE